MKTFFELTVATFIFIFFLTWVLVHYNTRNKKIENMETLAKIESSSALQLCKCPKKLEQMKKLKRLYLKMVAEEAEEVYENYCKGISND